MFKFEGKITEKYLLYMKKKIEITISEHLLKPGIIALF